MRFSPNNLQPAARACISMRDLGMSRARKNPTTYHWYPLIPSRADHAELPTDIHWYLFFSWQFSQSRPPTRETLRLVKQLLLSTCLPVGAALWLLWLGRPGNPVIRHPFHHPNWRPQEFGAARFHGTQKLEEHRHVSAPSPAWHGQPFPCYSRCFRSTGYRWFFECGMWNLEGAASRESLQSEITILYTTYVYIYIYIHICVYTYIQIWTFIYIIVYIYIYV